MVGKLNKLQCMFPGCRMVKMKRKGGLSFFGFPKDPDRLRIWCDQLQLPYDLVLDRPNNLICEKHFKHDEKKNCRLKRTTIPMTTAEYALHLLKEAAPSPQVTRSPPNKLSIAPKTTLRVPALFQIGVPLIAPSLDVSLPSVRRVECEESNYNVDNLISCFFCSNKLVDSQGTTLEIPMPSSQQNLDSVTLAFLCREFGINFNSIFEDQEREEDGPVTVQTNQILNICDQCEPLYNRIQEMYSKLEIVVDEFQRVIFESSEKEGDDGARYIQDHYATNAFRQQVCSRFKKKKILDRAEVENAVDPLADDADDPLRGYGTEMYVKTEFEEMDMEDIEPCNSSIPKALCSAAQKLCVSADDIEADVHVEDLDEEISIDLPIIKSKLIEQSKSTNFRKRPGPGRFLGRPGPKSKTKVQTEPEDTSSAPCRRTQSKPEKGNNSTTHDEMDKARHDEMDKASHANLEVSSEEPCTEHDMTSSRPSYPEEVKDYTCPECNKTFKSHDLDDIITHVKWHTLPTPAIRQYYCRLCVFCCTDPIELRLHEIGMHDEKLTHQCHLCKRKYGTDYLLTAHLQAHAKTPPYICTICSTTCEENHKLEEHIVFYHVPRNSDRNQTDTP